MVSNLLFRLIAAAIVVAGLAAASASPVPPPDLTKCQPAKNPDDKNTTNIHCCLPIGDNNIVDFKPPTYTKLRVRPSAHLADESYVAKYAKAIAIMKSLGPDHPWSHMQQANVHCAYCNGAYNMTGHNVTLQVHSSWLFLPFHRLYLYFYERILGKLIGDDTFAIPFWNWDSPPGMTIPKMYVNSSSSLYDRLRDRSHQPPTVVDFDYVDKDSPPTVNLTDRNLRSMNRHMVGARTAELFLGRRYVSGMQPSPGGGSIEMGPHNTVHSWTGDRRQTNGEDMGTFYAAGRDPIFFAHHANLDRLWAVWLALPGKPRRNFLDTDWLESSFIFWDENMRLVRAKVRDALDTEKLGYVYQDMATPWVNYKPMMKALEIKKAAAVAMSDQVELPVRLNSSVSIRVMRPKVLRSKEEEEVLVVDRIKLAKAALVKFDVYVNAGGGGEPLTVDSVHFAGSFMHLPMGMEVMGGRKGSRPATTTTTTRFLVGVTELLEDIKADRDRSIVVTLVPRKGGKKVMVGDVRIEFSS